MRVGCAVEEVTLENNEGREQAGVEVTCNRCEHSAQAYGTESASVRRCLATLREECPQGERNFYVDERED